MAITALLRKCLAEVFAEVFGGSVRGSSVGAISNDIGAVMVFFVTTQVGFMVVLYVLLWVSCMRCKVKCSIAFAFYLF